MKQKYTFGNLEDAKKAEDLFSWIQEYLHGPGHNKKLANHLLNATELTISFREQGIDNLKCVAGPDQSFKFPIDPIKYELAVSEYASRIEAGWSPPPLIVTKGIFGNEESIADGTHRLEALKRCGIHDFWVILVEKK